MPHTHTNVFHPADHRQQILPLQARNVNAQPAPFMKPHVAYYPEQNHPATQLPYTSHPPMQAVPQAPMHEVQKQSRHMKKMNGTIPGTLKLPPSAVFNEEGEWEETDSHRLAQRKKQLCFGKVTQGYMNYVAKVQKGQRQEGNELHPYTPRLNQVCSKRSWDCQVGRWRRTLHQWDSAPSAEEMRKAPEELRPSRDMKPLLMLESLGSPSIREKKPVNVKYTTKGDNICHLAAVSIQTTYAAFIAKMEQKVGRVGNMCYTDQDGDTVEVDDDCSLREFLEYSAATSPVPKLLIEPLSHCLMLISSMLSQDQKSRLAERTDLNLPATPNLNRKPLPELMDLITPTPEGKTPAMDVFNSLMKTPETECAERRRLTFG